MKKRRSHSTISKLPEAIQSKIAELSAQHTLDEILAHLKAMEVEVSRSALGRHVQKLPEIIERTNRSRIIAEALAEKVGDKPDNMLARGNIELTHTLVMEIMTKCEIDPETGEIRDTKFTPMEGMLIAKSLDHLASADKKDADRTMKLRQEALKQAATAVEKVGKAKGLTADTVKEIRAAVLGIKE